MHRLFVALPLPEPVTDQLIGLMDDGAPVNWQGEEQLHLTLRFIGPVERPLAEEIAAALQRVSLPPFELRLGGVGRFSRRRGGALWAGVAPREPVAALAGRIERAVQGCGLQPEARAFHPHITLARWSGPEPDLGPFLRRYSDLGSGPWAVSRFTLFESHLSRHGAAYEPVASYPAA